MTHSLLRWWEKYSVFAVYCFLWVDDTFTYIHLLVRRKRAKASEQEFRIGISCFERKLLNQILCLPGLPAIRSLHDTFSNIASVSLVYILLTVDAL